MARIQDYIIIGGDNQTEALETYAIALDKCDKVNLKVEPEKMLLFPESADVVGWIWKRGGYLEVSPHRKNTLVNMKETDIKKVKHLEEFYRPVQNITDSYTHDGKNNSST